MYMYIHIYTHTHTHITAYTSRLFWTTGRMTRPDRIMFRHVELCIVKHTVVKCPYLRTRQLQPLPRRQMYKCCI